MISIFNGRTRTLAGTQEEVWAKFDVGLRAHIREFKHGTNLNPWAVFTVLALHVNQDGWCSPSTELLKDETGLSTNEAISSALGHLRNLKINGKRILDHYRIKGRDNRWGKSYYRIFPEADESAPPVPDLILWNPIPPPGMPGMEIPAMEMPGVSLRRTNTEEDPENTISAKPEVSPIPENPVVESVKPTIEEPVMPTSSGKELEISPPVPPPPQIQLITERKELSQPLTDRKTLATDAPKPRGRAAKVATVPTWTPEVKDALAALTKRDWAIKGHGTQLGACLRDISGREPVTVDKLSRFRANWYKCDFRGQKGQAPTPHQVVGEWITLTETDECKEGSSNALPVNQGSDGRGMGNQNGANQAAGGQGQRDGRSDPPVPSIIPRAPGIPRPAKLPDLPGDGSRDEGRSD